MWNVTGIRNGKISFSVGDSVRCISSDYAGLTGIITEIRVTDKETENETPDIYCEFDIPDNPGVREELERSFSEAYGEPKRLEDLPLDLVIMAPEMLEVICE